MPECFACGKEIAETLLRLKSYRPRKFCDRKCYVKWSVKNKGIRQLVAERHKDHREINEAMAKAREGDTAARAFLKRFHGVRGLWNAKTKRIERW